MRLKRIVEMTQAYDERAHGYGIHGVDLRMVLKGPEGAVQFVLYTAWQLPHVRAEFDGKKDDHLLCHPTPADLGYHSCVPCYEGQTVVENECRYLDGRACYYDGSSLQAHAVFDVLLREGSEGVWSLLEEHYRRIFCAAVQP